jgi:hypothetical protein
LQDGFGLAKFRFDPQTRRVVRLAENADGQPANEDNGEPATRFMVYRDGRIYFEGVPDEIADTKDPYLQRFLV